ncbi:MAG: glycosyltransferase family 2 protein [Elusimicrobia bacterium]|nr:glycosyltransferase family 2 protein [Elusimicrobiota bacterium]
MPPKVAVIVLNYNGSQDTIDCLESLKKSDYPDFEILIVDNASIDDSRATLSSWAAAQPFGAPAAVLLESTANKGYAGGNNIGIRRALERGADYVWVLNNDTVVEGNTLSALVAAAQENPAIGLAGAALYHHDQPKKPQALGGGFINPWFGTSRHETKTGGKQLDYINGASILARASMIRQIGLLDERFFIYWEDADWSLRARQAGWALAWVPQARVRHKVGRTVNRGNLLADYHHALSGLLFFDKHAGQFFPWTRTAFLTGKLAKRLLSARWDALEVVLSAARLLRSDALQTADQNFVKS